MSLHLVYTCCLKLPVVGRVVDHALHTNQLLLFRAEIPDVFVAMGHALYPYRPMIDDIYHLLNLWVYNEVSALYFIALRAFDARKLIFLLQSLPQAFGTDDMLASEDHRLMVLVIE